MNSITDILDRQYDILDQKNIEGKKLTDKNKLNIINTIISIKRENIDLMNHNLNYSVDVKKYMNVLCSLEETTPVNYDNIKITQFEQVLEVLNFRDRISLLNYFLRQLRNHNFEDEIIKCQKLKTRITFKHRIKKWYNPKNAFLLIADFPTYSLVLLMTSILFIFIIYFVFTLPAIAPIFIFYKVEYSKFSDSFLLNHLLNTISGILQLDTDFRVKPINYKGIILSIVAKIAFFMIVTNYLLSKFIEITKR